ncbi:hypothetical protein CDCA_CDCA01G0170 [Cyanidium caldarium]|uniref:Pyrrolo-quinoline quinone repeat domain-containing protein n=1 Tax=Cyanidium caldarium TaxID=2771 RepID=A0AAV9IPX0_CYACA|nr:hypothetical protein CDCA_CDCA01G0170 [Cyanidium caldarium]
MASTALGPGGRAVEAISCSAACVDFCLGRQAPVLVAGLVDGAVCAYDVLRGSLAWRVTPFAEADAAVMTCARSADDALVAMGNAAGALSVVSMESGKPVWSHEADVGREDAGITAVTFLEGATDGNNAPPTVLISGSESGVVEFWDTRQAPSKAAVARCAKHSDYISSLQTSARAGRNTPGPVVLSTAADGTLSIIGADTAAPSSSSSARLGALIARSEPVGDELLSLAVVKGGRKVVCGTLLGALAIFSWGQWDDLSDRLVGHPDTVESLVTVDDDTLLTGCGDGLIRLVQVHPNRLLGVVGSADDEMPIERVDICASRAIVACCGHSERVQLFDVLYLYEDVAEEDASEHGEEDHRREGRSSRQAARRHVRRVPPTTTTSSNFFDGL